MELMEYGSDWLKANLFAWYEDANTTGVVCDELRTTSTHSPFIFFVVFGLLFAVILLTLVLFVTSRRRKRSDGVDGAGGGARFTARIRLVVVTGGRQRSPNSHRCRYTPTTTPSGRTRVVADTPGPDTTGKDTS